MADVAAGSSFSRLQKRYGWRHPAPNTDWKFEDVRIDESRQFKTLAHLANTPHVVWTKPNAERLPYSNRMSSCLAIFRRGLVPPYPSTHALVVHPENGSSTWTRGLEADDLAIFPTLMADMGEIPVVAISRAEEQKFVPAFWWERRDRKWITK